FCLAACALAANHHSTGRGIALLANFDETTGRDSPIDIRRNFQMATLNAVCPRASLLNIDDAVFAQNFPHQGFKITHQLCDQPELRWERLVQLAQRLPANQVEYYSGKVDVNQDPGKHPKNGLSLVETIRRIEECGSWLVLKNVQSDPAYGALLRNVLD